MSEQQPPVTQVPQPLTDDSLIIRQVSHYQFTYVAGPAGESGTWTLQLVLDQGAWEEVLTLDEDDADLLLKQLSASKHVMYDVRRRTLVFGVTKVGD